MEKFFETNGIEFLIKHQDLLNILRDFTTCPRRLKLIFTIQDYIESIQYFRRLSDSNKSRTCRLTTIIRSVQQDSENVQKLNTALSFLVINFEELIQVIKQISRLVLLEKRLKEIKQNGINP